MEFFWRFFVNMLKFLQKFWKSVLIFFLKPFFAFFFVFLINFLQKLFSEWPLILWLLYNPKFFSMRSFYYAMQKKTTLIWKKNFFCFFLAKTVVGKSILAPNCFQCFLFNWYFSNGAETAYFVLIEWTVFFFHLDLNVGQIGTDLGFSSGRRIFEKNLSTFFFWLN